MSADARRVLKDYNTSKKVTAESNAVEVYHFHTPETPTHSCPQCLENVPLIVGRDSIPLRAVYPLTQRQICLRVCSRQWFHDRRYAPRHLGETRLRFTEPEDADAIRQQKPTTTPLAGSPISSFPSATSISIYKYKSLTMPPTKS
jgi:hypothetical protein